MVCVSFSLAAKIKIVYISLHWGKSCSDGLLTLSFPEKICHLWTLEIFRDVEWEFVGDVETPWVWRQTESFLIITLAPFARSASTASVLFHLTAKCKGVQWSQNRRYKRATDSMHSKPTVSTALIDAPAFTSSWIISEFPHIAARWSGVKLKLSRVLGSAPIERSMPTICGWPETVAIANGVL